MSSKSTTDVRLREALEASGQRFTEQRAAVFRYLARTDVHPTAEEVFLAVRTRLPAISLATVYKSLETLVGCGLAVKLTYGDHSARYDGRTDPHHHARCVSCEKVLDMPGELLKGEIDSLRATAGTFTVTGYRLELSGYCPECVPAQDLLVTT
ncbi:transcriptional repressor [Gemmatimonadales bacterium]|nr:transcriptional repressor [Gemmatimonadales bacterium]